MFNRIIQCLLLAFALAACSQPAPVKPALWLVEGPGGQKAWLFGTIHALPDPVDWRSPVIETALAGADSLVLEVAAIDDDGATAAAFARLAQGGPHPPLEDRVRPDLEDELAAELKRYAIPPGSLNRYDTWAAALMISQAQSQRDAQDSGNGIDRALAKGWRGKIAELEGAEAQLAIFDTLPEPQQRALLAAVVEGSERRISEARLLENAWATGDLAAIDRATNAETFGDFALREALLVRRNQAWTVRLVAVLRGGGHPFVAVGAGHMVGKDGLPAMLMAQGYKITRLQ